MPNLYAHTPQATKINLLTSKQRKAKSESAIPPMRGKGLFSLITKDIKDITIGLGSFAKRSLFSLIGIEQKEKLKF